MSTEPIPITPKRSRSSSIPALSHSPTSPLQGSLQTPSSMTGLRNAPGGSPTSPLSSISAYFLGSGPSSPTFGKITGFPFSSKNPAEHAIDENEESPPLVTPGTYDRLGHARRASTSGVTGTWATSNNNPAPFTERGSGVLRRLSLSSGGGMQRPFIGQSIESSAAPQPSLQQSAISPDPAPRRKPRSATMSEPRNRKRGISPMGERLLKGSFDGFI